MAKTLENIQIGARFNARSDELVISTGYGLATFNSIYRKVCKALPWPELRYTQTATTSVSGQAQYTWVTASVYMDVVSVEVGSDASDTAMNLMIPPHSEHEWNEAAKDSSGVPVYYKRFSSALNNMIEFRPTLDYSSATIRATGTVQPTELSLVSDTTVFLTSTADDVLEYVIAAEFLMSVGNSKQAEFNIATATKALRDIFGDELVPAELIKNIIGVSRGVGGGGSG